MFSGLCSRYDPKTDRSCGYPYNRTGLPVRMNPRWGRGDDDGAGRATPGSTSSTTSGEGVDPHRRDEEEEEERPEFKVIQI